MNLQQLHEEGDREFDAEFPYPWDLRLLKMRLKSHTHSERTKAWNAALEWAKDITERSKKDTFFYQDAGFVRNEITKANMISNVALDFVSKCLSEGMEKEGAQLTLCA